METPRVASLLDFRGKVVLVTGAGGGLGGGIAARFAEAGAAGVAPYRRHGDEAAALVLRITGEGGRAIPAAGDLRPGGGGARPGGRPRPALRPPGGAAQKARPPPLA